MAASGKRSFNYAPWVWVLSIVVNVTIALLFLSSGHGRAATTEFDITILPMTNAILNTFTFVFLSAAFFWIRRKDVTNHRRFILAAFVTTTLFMISYVTYHFLAESTRYGGEGWLAYVYYFILLTHIVLAVVIVPLALISLFSGLAMDVRRHRRISRWTMPLWLYVSITGVAVYLMISPYYGT